MNVLMRHWHYLLHQSGLFFPFFSISALPTWTLFPLPSVECVCEQRLWTQTLATCFCCQRFFFFFFFFFSPPLSCWCFLFGMQEGDHRATKSYTDENWGCLLFVSSAIPRCPPSHFSSGVTSLLFPVVLEPCQQTPLDRDMQILSLENSSASQPSCPWLGHFLDIRRIF